MPGINQELLDDSLDFFLNMLALKPNETHEIKLKDETIVWKRIK